MSSPPPAAAHPSPDGAAGRPAAVVTASDGVARGTREDRSGDALAIRLAGDGFDVVARAVVPDERDRLVDTVTGLCDDGVRLVVVTGGTGLGPRDVTPEALADLGDRVVPGFGEVMRATGRSSTPMADLSRSVAVARGASLVIGVPGSPTGASESLAAVAVLLPHALDLLAGDTSHAAGDTSPATDGSHEQDDAHHGEHAHGGHDHAGHGDQGSGPAHGEPGHVHDEACALAHGDVPDPTSAGTLMAVFASPLSALLLAWGRELGWSTVLVDPRIGAGGDTPPDALREVDGMVVTATTASADAHTDVVVTDHHRDELVDLLDTALDTPARFIGLMGSPRHAGPHVGPLRDRGRSADELDRIVRPIGIPIGSRTPAEIAVSTLADLVARRHGVDPTA